MNNTKAKLQKYFECMKPWAMQFYNAVDDYEVKQITIFELLYTIFKMWVTPWFIQMKLTYNNIEIFLT